MTFSCLPNVIYMFSVASSSYYAPNPVLCVWRRDHLTSQGLCILVLTHERSCWQSTNQCLSAFRMAGFRLQFSLGVRTCGQFQDEEFVHVCLVCDFWSTPLGEVCRLYHQNVIRPNRQFFRVSISSTVCIVPSSSCTEGPVIPRLFIASLVIKHVSLWSSRTAYTLT